MKIFAWLSVVFVALAFMASGKFILRGEYPRYPKITCGGEVLSVVWYGFMIWFLLNYLIGGGR